MACQTFVNGDVSVSWIPLALRKPAKPPVQAGESAPTTTPPAADV